MESEFLLVWVPTALLHLAYPQPLSPLLKARCMASGIAGARYTVVTTQTKPGRESGGVALNPPTPVNLAWEPHTPRPTEPLCKA